MRKKRGRIPTRKLELIFSCDFQSFSQVQNFFFFFEKEYEEFFPDVFKIPPTNTDTWHWVFLHFKIFHPFRQNLKGFSSSLWTIFFFVSVTWHFKHQLLRVHQNQRWPRDSAISKIKIHSKKMKKIWYSLTSIRTPNFNYCHFSRIFSNKTHLFSTLSNPGRNGKTPSHERNKKICEK